MKPAEALGASLFVVFGRSGPGRGGRGSGQAGQPALADIHAVARRRAVRRPPVLSDRIRATADRAADNPLAGETCGGGRIRSAVTVSWWKIAAGVLGLLTTTDVCCASDANDTVLPRLAGTIVAPATRQALVQLDTTRTYVVLKIGDILDTWTVESIEAGAIRLAGANGWVDLTLSGTRSIDKTSSDDVKGVLSFWTHPCGRVHAPQDARPLRDTGACVRALVGSAAS